MERSPEGVDLQLPQFLLRGPGPIPRSKFSTKNHRLQKKQNPVLSEDKLHTFLSHVAQNPLISLEKPTRDSAVTGRSPSRQLNIGFPRMPCWFSPHSPTCAFYCRRSPL